MAEVEFRGVCKTYPGGIEAVGSIDLRIGDGERFAIVGPSGSGKSTLLRLIAGLETPTSGTLAINGRRVDGLPPRERDVAMVFQNPALYPHLTVFENLAFGLRARGQTRAVIDARVSDVAALLGLSLVLDRRPRSLSGGQRQRVALGRAIVRRPSVFLFDEPLSSLDAPLRAALRDELIDLHRRLTATMVLVTHDQAEALAFGERIAVVQRGRLVQLGSPPELYHRPASRFVAEFIGSPPMSVIPCDVSAADGLIRVRPLGVEVDWSASSGDLWAAPLGMCVGGRIGLGLRAEDVSLTPSESSARWSVLGELLRIEPLGHEQIATVALGAHALRVRLPNSVRIQIGEVVPITFDPARATWFDESTGDALNRADDCRRHGEGLV